MQSYFVVRGHADKMDRLKNDLLAQYLPYEYNPGKIGLLQLGVRKIEIWELAYPKDQHDAVMGMMAPFDDRKQGLISFLRRILGLKTLRVGTLKPTNRVVKQDVSVMPIGFREDKFAVFKHENLDYKRELI